MYCALIGDIIASRELPNRSQVQDALKDTFLYINETYADHIASDFTLTLGDEFQGLLGDMSKLFEIIDSIRFQHLAIDIRFGVGIGSMLTTIDRNASIGADGPAYWNARAALNSVHAENDYHRSKVRIEGELDINWTTVANDSLRLCDFIESRWRASQRDFVAACVRMHGHDTTVKQTKLAEELGLTPQAVNQKVQTSGYYQWVELKQDLGRTLQADLAMKGSTR
jgi:hypothetical protein